jgi:hypothetical protein
MVATDNSMLKKETNVIHDNGATISLMDKQIADAIGLRGRNLSNRSFNNRGP